MMKQHDLIQVLQSVSYSGKGITFINGEADEAFICYGDLYETALYILYNLQEKGVWAGDEAVFQIEDPKEFICCFWACILGGIIPVPLTVGNIHEHRMKVFRVWNILKRPWLIINNKTLADLEEFSSENGLQETLTGISARLLTLGDIVRKKDKGYVFGPGPIANRTAFIQFSSGSTADPKGVVLSHENLISNINAIIKGTNCSGDDSSLSWMPLTHDMGLIGFHISPLAAGLNQYLMPASLFVRRPGLWLKKTHEHRISILSSPNFGYKYFMNFFKPESAAGWDLSCVKTIFNGAEPISADLCCTFLDMMKEYKLKRNVMFPVYGLAEASLAVTFPPKDEELSVLNLDREFLSIGGKVTENNEEGRFISFVDLGFPVEGCQVKICDDKKRSLEENTIGYVYIKGKNVTTEYYNNQRATRQTITDDGWLNTGDLGFMRNGRLVITGRAKDIIFINGQNYYPHDIERLVEGIGGLGLGEIAACGVYNEDVQREDVSLFVLYKKELKEFAQLALKIKKHINSSMGLDVKNIVPVKKLPKTTSGKIQRYKLAESFKCGEYSDVVKELEDIVTTLESKKPLEAPENEIEEKILRIWCDVLGVKNISVNDSFLEIGGDSLKGAVMLSRVLQEFMVEVPVSRLFELATVRKLSEYISGLEKVNYKPMENAGTREYYPVSSAQKRLFILDSIEKGSTTYNMPAAYILEGKLDTRRIEKSFNGLLARHEALRTSFRLKDEEPVQMIHENISIDLKVIEQGSRDIDHVIKDFIKPFDLGIPPLMRVCLVRQSDEKHMLLVDMHHIISDGISSIILAREFAELYEGKALPKLEVQYKDFALWQNNVLSDEDLSKQKQFWTDEFKGEIPVLNMPVDFVRPASQSFKGSRIRFITGSELFLKLHSISVKKGVTLYMLLLASFNVLLSKYSGQEDIVTGTPVSGRYHPDIQNVVGMFVNTLALRSFPSGDKYFSDFLIETGDKTLKAFSNQQYQFEMLVDELDIKRNLGRNPLFDTMFVYQNMGKAAFDAEGLKISSCSFDSGVSKFDLTLFVTEKNGSFEFELEYCTDLFKSSSALRMSEHFLNILRTIADNPDIRISDIQILSKEEEKALIYDFNRTQTWYPMEKTIVELFENQVEKTPQNAALEFGTVSLTYLELNKRANSLAAILRSNGVMPNSITGIMCERTPELIIAILAVLKAGGAYLPIDTSYPAERISYMLGDSGAGVLLTQSIIDNEQLTIDNEKQIVLINLDDESLYTGEAENPYKVNKADDLAYVIYTSGSTGKPKGAMIEHKGLVNYIWWAAKNYIKGEKIGFPLYTSISFDLTVTSIFAPLITGNSVIIYPDDPKGLLIEKVLKENRVDVIKLTPAHMKLIKDMDNRNSRVRCFIVGGEQLETALAKSIYENFGGKIEIYNEYGPTETVVGCMIYKYDIDRDNRFAVPIGIPADNARIYILDRYMKPVPVNVEGEMYIAGDGVCRGYINKPELTAEKFLIDPFYSVDNVQCTVYSEKPNKSMELQEGQEENNCKLSIVNCILQSDNCRLSSVNCTLPSARMYRTGDLARMLEDGNIEYIGRIDHQVKIRGCRIEPGEIESLLTKHNSVKWAIVIDRTNKDGNKYLCAYYTSDEDIPGTAFRDYLSKDLPDYMIPSYFIKVPGIPLTNNGKIDRSALPEPENKIPSGGKYDEPATEMEKIISEVWKQVLGVEKIGVNDNFFELGGDSINAIRVVSKLGSLGYDVSVKDVMTSQTICLLSQAVKAGSKNKTYDQGILTGDAGINPITNWFLSHNFSNPNHYNQSVLLQFKRDIDSSLLEKALNIIIEHHDGLRINYDPESGRLFYNNKSLAGGMIIEHFDISSIQEEEIPGKIESIGQALKSGFDITNGLLIKAALIGAGKNRKYLLITAHHLVIDGVSWRVLLEDLFNLYISSENGSEALLPAKTASLREWNLRLEELSQSADLIQEAECWAEMCETHFAAPQDFTTDDWTMDNRKALKFHIDTVKTQKLTGMANRAYNTETQDLLLTALALAVRDWTEKERIIVELENHGRHLEDVDVSRTVGWFTAIHPLCLDTAGEDIGLNIVRVKEKIREIPAKGIGYGIIKYMKGIDLQNCGNMAFIRFNFLGSFKNEVDNELFTAASNAHGSEICSKNNMTAKIEINCMVVKSKLEIEMLYNSGAYAQKTLEYLKDCFLNYLDRIITQTETEKEKQFTPSDFKTAGINQEDLDILFEQD